jgi:hypothetical protein
VVRRVPTAAVEVGDHAEPVDGDVGASEDVVEPLAGWGTSKSLNVVRGPWGWSASER